MSCVSLAIAISGRERFLRNAQCFQCAILIPIGNWQWFDRLSFSRVNPLIVFGRVPLFYFVLHFFAAHLAILALSVMRYGGSAWSFMMQPVPSMGGPAKAFPPGFGYDLWVAYAVWIAIVIGLYPVCRWYAGLKERNRSWWLSYL